MPITLGEILRWGILEEATVITDSFDSGAAVENITIMEAPDIGKWVDKNSILLTGLYNIYGDKRKTAEFVDSLHSGKVRALFVKIQRFVDAVPEPIISACQELGIALVEMPGHIRYIDIMYPVIASIFESRVVQLNHHKHTLNALAGLALGNRGVNSIARAFAGLVENPVILHDAVMECLYATNDAFAVIEHSEALEEGVVEDLDYRIQKVRFAGDEKEYRQLLIPIRIFGQTKMYLSIIEHYRAITRMDFVALENVVTVLSFELVKHFAKEEVESRFKQEIVEDIRLGRNLDSIRERLISVNLRASVRYNAFLVEMPAAPISRTPAIVKQRLVNRNAVKVHDLFLSVKEKQGLSGFESYGNNNVTAFFAEPAASDATCSRALETLCTEFLAKAEAAFPGMPLHIGYTSSFRDLSHITEAYKNARDALHVSRTLYGENSFCNYDELGMYKVLCMARDRGELEACIPPSITRLEDYQASSGLPLLETLDAYFKHNGNIQQTAKALFIHYKTLYYRLHRIESVAGVDLKNNTQTFEMQMGLNILRILEGRREA
ncbi:PucR family transcriptional regulator [Desulfovibrio sp. OttesenSCG-928-I05]|nr:PucR family transcriptional regulator [Desulfovibrio sp. OttesenSCG-928-I05]